MTNIRVYGKPDCTDTARSRALLEARGVAYEYVDIAADAEARQLAEVASGSTKAPVVAFPDGFVLVEPSDEELGEALARA